MVLISSNSLMALDIKDSKSIKSFIQSKQIECDNNNKKSCYQLGDFFISLNSKDNAEKYLTKACQIGSAEACYSLDTSFSKNL